MSQQSSRRRGALALAAGLLLLALPAAADQVASLSAAAQGSEGCYFGECPEPGSPTPKVPPEQAGPDWNGPQPTPPNQTPWPVQQVTAICQTPAFWCQMGEVGPVGANCWCSDWYGNVHYGWTVPQ